MTKKKNKIKFIKSGFGNFRKYEKKNLKKKENQYRAVALKIEEVINEMGYPKSEGGFELAKVYLINNEEMSLWLLVKNAFKELVADFKEWIPIVISFLLGILADNIADLTFTMFCSSLVIILALGFMSNCIVKALSDNLEYLHLRILKEMTYAEYQVLIKIK